MKKLKLTALMLVLILIVTGCGNTSTSPTNSCSSGSNSNNSNNTDNSNNSNNSGNNSSDTGTITLPEGTKVDYVSLTTSDPVAVSASDASANKTSITGAFQITGGNYTVDGSTYTITEEGEYTLTGLLEGNIIIEADENSKVTLILNGVSISSSTAAPIYVKSASKVTIKAEEGSYNEINDNRAAETTNDENAESTPANGAGAITAKTDLTVSGKGSLVITGSYKNGIHTTKDLSIKNLTLKVSAENNAIKGKDSIEIKDANIIAIAFSGDAIKTENTDVSSKGNQRGSITIESSTIDVYAACDGIYAAYDLLITGSSNINVKTSSYSEYSKEVTSSSSSSSSSTSGWGWGGFGGGGFGGGFGGGGNTDKTSYSSKGLKAGNSITVEDGIIYISVKDDGLHAKAETLENGQTGAGLITISGGSLIINASDDGIHAETTLNIIGGYINIKTSYEGFESNIINITGGTSFIYATDDGINACGGSATPCINVTGGYVDVTTASGDTDAIDSNGYYKQSGGFVLVKGGSSSGNVAGSVDVDKSITVTGGTIIAFGGICETPESSQNGYTANGQSFSAGTYTLSDSDGNIVLMVSLPSSYSSMWVSSDLLVTGSSYTFSKDSSTLLSWTQTSGHMGSSGGFGGGGNFGPGGNGGNGGGGWGGPGGGRR